LLGIAAAWASEQLDSSLKTPDDVEQWLGVTFLGLLPEYESEGSEKEKAKRRSRRKPKSGDDHTPELNVHEEPVSGVAEAARAVRTNLMFINPDRPARVLLITSAAPAEGKTMVACSIAIALAQSGQRVCLVDCDLRRPRMHRIFQRPGTAGVTNVLVGESNVDDIIGDTPVRNLSVVCAGPLPPNPADVLHSERFKVLLRDLSERFDRVIIDSPPLVAVTDGAIISRLVDGTVFVVRAFKTSRQLANQGLRALRDVEAPVVGAVLNAVKLGRPEYAYYYHYKYYRRGASYAEEGKEHGPEPADPTALN
jgi:capsular exopolysaccharide synthesis family protein